MEKIFQKISNNPEVVTGSTQRRSRRNLEKKKSLPSNLAGSLYNQLNRKDARSRRRIETHLSEEILNSESNQPAQPVEQPPKPQVAFDILAFLKSHQKNNIGKKFMIKSRRSNMAPSKPSEELRESEISRLLGAEKNDTIFNLHQQNEKNLRNFQTSFDDILMQHKQGMADVYSSTRNRLHERELLTKQTKVKKKFFNMKKKHYQLLRLSLSTLLGFRETHKVLALFFKAKSASVFGVVRLLSKLDDLFVKKLTLSIFGGRRANAFCRELRNLPRMRLARRHLRKSPCSIAKGRRN